MDLTVLYGETVIPLNVSSDFDIATIKVLLEGEIGLPANNFLLLYKQRPLEDYQTLQQVGVIKDDVLEAIKTADYQRQLQAQASSNSSGAAAAAAANQGGNSLSIPRELLQNPAALQQFIRSNPPLLEQLRHVNPPFYHAVMQSTPEPLSRLLQEQERIRKLEEEKERERIRLLQADPFDVEAQRKIEEEIRLKNVQENMEAAIEYDPAVFARVVMLYVPLKVNGTDMTAFVDSGAQSTIMSASCAERCGILRLIDTRFAGIAKGVGTSKILGRVHSVPVQIGKLHITSSFTILENQDMDLLFGLDQLKKHQCMIDLKDNVLRIGEEAIPFLAEKDLPAKLRGEDAGEMKQDEPRNNSSTSNNSTTTTTSSSSSKSNSNSNTNTTSATSAASTSNTRIPSHSTLLQGRPASSTPLPSSSTHVSLPSASAAVATAAGRLTDPAVASLPPPAHSPSPIPAAAAAPAPAAAAPVSNANSISPAAVESLVQLGFDRQQSIAALQLFQGNVDAAASHLFNQQMGF